MFAALGACSASVHQETSDLDSSAERALDYLSDYMSELHVKVKRKSAKSIKVKPQYLSRADDLIIDAKMAYLRSKSDDDLRMISQHEVELSRLRGEFNADDTAAEDSVRKQFVKPSSLTQPMMTSKKKSIDALISSLGQADLFSVRQQNHPEVPLSKSAQKKIIAQIESHLSRLQSIINMGSINEALLFFEQILIAAAPLRDSSSKASLVMMDHISRMYSQLEAVKQIFGESSSMQAEIEQLRSEIDDIINATIKRSFKQARTLLAACMIHKSRIPVSWFSQEQLTHFRRLSSCLDSCAIELSRPEELLQSATQTAENQTRRAFAERMIVQSLKIANGTQTSPNGLPPVEGALLFLARIAKNFLADHMEISSGKVSIVHLSKQMKLWVAELRWSKQQASFWLESQKLTLDLLPLCFE